MTFWIQHGHGKAEKIRTVARSQDLAGVVLSPADEDRSSLYETARSVESLGSEALLDPQLYVHTIKGAAARCHAACGIDFGELSWILGPADIRSHIDSVLTLNQELNISRVIAPSPYQASFGDAWTPISLQYASAMIDSTDRPVFVSLVAEDAAFSDWSNTQSYLDVLTTLDAAGIYLIVGTSSQNYPVTWEPDRLANVLRCIYVLSELNEYEVLVGYSEIAGIAAVAAGASGAATGWYNSLRMWKTGKWVPQSGGRPATPRLLVDSLLSPIERSGEAVGIARTTIANAVFADAHERQSLQREAPWGISDSWNQYLLTMAKLHSHLVRGSGTLARVQHLLTALHDAAQLLVEVGDSGAAINPAYVNRIGAIAQAVESFALLEDL